MLFQVTLILLLCVADVSAHGAFVSLNSQPYSGTGEGLYGARNWRTHKLHQGQLVHFFKRRFLTLPITFKTQREWDPYSLAGQGGRQDPIMGEESSWADISCGEPGQTQHNIQYDTLASDWKVPILLTGFRNSVRC